MRKAKFPVTNMGTVSIMTIFIILCLVAFSALSLVSANNEMSFAGDLSDRTQSYYKASNEAQEVIQKFADDSEIKANEPAEFIFSIDEISDLHVTIVKTVDGTTDILEYKEVPKNKWKQSRLFVYQ